MNRIRLLSEQVANQIAAGEVVERPSSVVKELVENSLDAGAKRITVEIQAGGRSLIRVTDDGSGMSRDDALLSLERHATSKIQRAEDLASIATMGFRGEALPSIASVSRFTLTTREETGDAEGTQILINGGKILEVKAAGGAAGTSVEVRQLFYNLPARRKFLRSEETEFAHIQHYLTLAALAHPEVAFTFLKEGRIVWQLPAEKRSGEAGAKEGALRERLRALLGSELRLLAVNFRAALNTAEHDDENSASSSIMLWGFVGAPGVSRATREDQYLFVNRRPIENRGLNFALLEGYHTALMKGRYPVCCLFLEINPSEVDVNIHPSKREVKFHQERAVRLRVTEAIQDTLRRFHLSSATPAPQIMRAPPTETTRQPATGSLSTSAVERPPAPPVLPLFPFPPATPAPAPVVPPKQTPLPMGFAPPSSLRSESPGSSASTTRSETSPNDFRPVPLLAVPLRFVGVIARLYVVLESDRGLVLLDQHAAHERVLFEQMLRRLEGNGSAPSQRLLLPETIEVSARDANFLRQQLPELSRLGVGLSEFGERTFLLDALPPFVKVPEPRPFVLQLVDELKAAGEGVNSLRLGEHVVAKTVCRHSVKANDPLARAELENLIEQLRHCSMPYTCPHGRPTLIEMNLRELEKKFGRTA